MFIEFDSFQYQCKNMLIVKEFRLGSNFRLKGCHSYALNMDLPAIKYLDLLDSKMLHHYAILHFFLTCVIFSKTI